MSKRWYVVHVYSGQEKSVEKALRERIEASPLAHMFGESLLPTEEVVEIKDGQKKTSERRFFPGYILLEMEMTDETWHLVKSSPKVTGFIGGKANKPAPIPQAEVDKVRSQMQQGVEKPRHKVTFEVGETVRIKEGPFADFNGTVEDVLYDKNRVKVSVSIFGRATSVEIEFAQVEKQ